MSSSQSAQSARRPRRSVPLEDLALQERDSIFRAPSGGDWIMLGLVAAGLIGTGLYDWLRLGIDDHTGRAVFFGLLLVAIFWGAVVYIFKLSMSVLVGPRGISLVRGPWRTELFWRDTARLVERTLPDGGQRFRWVVVMARDGRELRVREDMVQNYMRFRAEVYERYLLWRDHGGTWGASGGGDFTATDVVSNIVTWWLFGGTLALLPGLYFWFLLPETGLTGLVLLGITAFCCLEALFTFLGRQTYSVGTKEITRKRTAQPPTHLLWRNVSRIERTRHPAGGLIRVGIGIGRLLLAIASRTDSRFKSFEWSPRVPEYLILRGEGRHVKIRLHRLTRPDEMLAWVEYYERIGRRGDTSASRPVDPSRSAAPRTVPIAPDASPREPIPSGAAGPADPWADGRNGEFPADAYPTELQPSVTAPRPPLSSHPAGGTVPRGVPPSVAATYMGNADGFAGISIEEERPEGDSWLWDTSKMPSAASASSPDIFARPSGQFTPRAPRADSDVMPTAPAFPPPPTGGPAFMPQPSFGAPTPPTTQRSPSAPIEWWSNTQADPTPSRQQEPAQQSWQPPAPDYQPQYPQQYQYPPEYPSAYHSPEEEEDEQPTFGGDDNAPFQYPPFVQQPADYPPPAPPEEQGPSEREMYDENLAQSQRWRNQQNWQPPQLPRFGPQPEDKDKQGNR